MQINSSNINFTSRNATIRYADDIARKINNVFPRVSQSRIYSYKKLENFGFLEFRLREQTRQIRNLKSSRFDNATNSFEKLCAFLNPIKERKLGNCAESAQIAAISAKLNGVNDVYVAVLKTKGGRKLDHAVLYVENGKNPYIIDPWLGIADYVPKMFEKYISEYKEMLNICKYLKLSDIKFAPIEEDAYSRFLKKEITKEDTKKLLELYPQLLV